MLPATLGLLISLLGGVEMRQPAKSCPAAPPDHTDYLRQFFSAEESRPFREQNGLLGIQPADVRVLTDAYDSEACRRIAGAVTIAQNGPYPKVWRGYRAGSFFVMVVTMRAPDGVLHHGGGGIIVLDGEFQVVAAT